MAPAGAARTRCERNAGVDAVFDLDAGRAGLHRIDAARDRAHGSAVLPLVLTADDAQALGLADPWDEDLVQRASRHFADGAPKLVALPNALLQLWLRMDEQQAAASGATAGAVAVSATGPVVGFVDDAIRAAYQGGASDIHFECDRQGVTVKLRQDGVMARLARMDDPRRAEEVISRIKVLAQLDITERRTPQDGRFRTTVGGNTLDLRVSIMPSVFGEDAVLRLLDKANLRTRDTSITLDLLGFDAASVERIRDLAELPHGLLLVTGPTGSGKTTTVYAALSEINTGEEKIITIEDPVEYELPGVLQSPVNERKGLTFAKGLRSILRHDPDRILVGEIRDAETAEIAVQSALTGHQVFTTVHANSVFDVTGRFRHFGLDMFGFMFSLNGIVVQRLVRTLCVHCATWRSPSVKELRWLAQLGLQANEVPGAVGCERCHGTGYQGRRVLAEVHAIDDAFRDLVAEGGSASQLRAHVSNSDTVALALQAARWVLSGVTTAEEIKRVVGWQ